MIPAAGLLLLLGWFLFRAHLRLSRRERAFSLLENRPSLRKPELVREAARRAAWGKLFSSRKKRFFVPGVFGLAVLLFTRNPLLALLPIPVFPIAKRFLDGYRKNKREQSKEEQVLEFIDSLTQSLRSGLSLQQSLEASIEDVGRELGEEIQILLKEIQMGGGLEESLFHAAEASTSPSMRLSLTVLGLLHGKGGDLPRVLERMRKRVAEGLEARREMRILTSQSRASGYLVSALPLAFFSLQAVISPASLRPLFSTPAGNLVIAVSLILNGAGFFLIRRLVNPEV